MRRHDSRLSFADHRYHAISFTGPITKKYESAASIATTAIITKARMKCPVKLTTNPVKAGAMTPARFPTKFWKPVQRPAILGPASVCVMAQILDPHIPPAANARSNRITETVGPARAQPRRSSPALPAPTPAKVLRTSVGLPPAAIHRSEIKPKSAAPAE